MSFPAICLHVDEDIAGGAVVACLASLSGVGSWKKPADGAKSWLVCCGHAALKNTRGNKSVGDVDCIMHLCDTSKNCRMKASAALDHRLWGQMAALLANGEDNLLEEGAEGD